MPPPLIQLAIRIVNDMTVVVNCFVAVQDPTFSITSISWSWGDGSSSTSWSPATHTYRAPKSYMITATAHQSDGATGSASVAVQLQNRVVAGTRAPPGPTLLLCPFCNGIIHWAMSPLTYYSNGRLEPWSYEPQNLKCSRCGTIAAISQVSDDEREVILKFIKGGSSLDSVTQFFDSLAGPSSEASKAIAYAVLGGFTQKAIEQLHYKVVKRTPDAPEFERMLKEILNRFQMRFCPYCGRAVPTKDAFCIYCGRATY